MSKNIVICSDGTGNRGGKTRGTNVWRIFNSIDRHDDSNLQITYYDDGVGTDDLRLLRLLSGAFGWGLQKNIRQAYEFLTMNYQEGDKIFLFGFSRGAFTVRSLAGLICRCGLLRREILLQAGRQERKRMVNKIINAYRSNEEFNNKNSGVTKKEKAKNIRKNLGLTVCHLQSVPIHFVGVWDTVDAVGVPVDELKEWVDRIWRKLFKRRLWGFYDQVPHYDIHHLYQALALDDERKTFHPNVWKGDCKKSESDDRKKQVVEQVWFAGAHSNVGGGYPKDSLSLVPLLWMMGKANACGLKFFKSKCKEYYEAADPHGRLYDSRAGLGVFYRPALRQLPKYSLIHKSVFERIERGTNYYAPKIIRDCNYIICNSHFCSNCL